MLIYFLLPRCGDITKPSCLVKAAYVKRNYIFFQTSILVTERLLTDVLLNFHIHRDFLLQRTTEIKQQEQMNLNEVF